MVAEVVTEMAKLFMWYLCILGIAKADPNVFSSTSMPRDGYVPNVGNGFIGYDTGCPSSDESSSAGYLFIAGVYSGGSQSASLVSMLKWWLISLSELQGTAP